MKRNYTSLLLFLLSFQITLFSQPQGFFLHDWSPKSIQVSSKTDASKPSGATTVTVNADYSNIITKVSKYIYGNNANDYSGRYNLDSGMVKKVNDLQPQVIRFPGGNNANWYFWDRTPGNWPADCPEKNADGNPMEYRAGFINNGWQFNLTDYYQFLQQTNSTGIITVNYSYARYSTAADPVATAAHYAAQWVRYDNGRTKFWEVGNENYGNWQSGYKINTATNKDKQPQFITGEIYGKHFRVFADSMKAAAAEKGFTIYVGAVGYDAFTPGGGVIANWNEQVIPQIKDKADYYIVHNYFTNWGENTSAANILTSAITESSKSIETVYTKMDEYDCPRIPVALTEWNINAVGSKQQVSNVNGIHGDLVLGELIKSGYGLATRWDLANHWAGGDDHGMFTWGAEPGVPLFNARPVFYHMYYFQKYFGDMMIKSTVDGSSDIIAYASKFNGSGQTGMVVVNKGTAEKLIKLNISNFKYGEKYYVYTLVGDGSEFSRKVFVNGQTTKFEGGGPENYDTLAPISYKIIDNEIVIKAPARSSNYVLIESSEVPENPVVSKIQLEKDTFRTVMGQTCQINYTVYDTSNAIVQVTPHWYFSPEASVNNNGVFLSYKPGIYTVMAQIDAFVDTTTIIVSPISKLSIGLDTIRVEIETSVQLSVKGFDHNNYPVAVVPAWTTTGGGTIDTEGNFTANELDTAIIYATYDVMVDSVVVIVVPAKPCTKYSLTDKIEAENWCKMAGVQTEGTSDAGGGMNVGWIDNNDWLKYFLTVDTGAYQLNLRIAAQSSVGKVTVILEGNSTDTLTLNKPLVVTGGWQNWKTVTFPVTIKNKGDYMLNIISSTGGWNLNWLQFSKKSTGINEQRILASALFPNPLTGNTLNISIPEFKQNMVIVRIIDIIGKNILSAKLKTTNGKAHLELPIKMKPGIYNVVVSSGNKIENLKLFIPSLN